MREPDISESCICRPAFSAFARKVSSIRAALLTPMDFSRYSFIIRLRVYHMKIIINKLISWQIMRYIISGGSGAVVNLATLFVLVHFFQIWYLLSVVLAFVVAFFVSFSMQKFFTFNERGLERIKQQSILYLGIQIFNLGVNAMFMYISVDILNIHYLISQFFILGFIAAYSFFIFKHFIFNR